MSPCHVVSKPRPGLRFRGKQPTLRAVGYAATLAMGMIKVFG
jgi:hypothetical protein